METNLCVLPKMRITTMIRNPLHPLLLPRRRRRTGNRKRKRPANNSNLDELDDVDEWKAEIDGDEEDRENPYAEHERSRKTERRYGA